MESSSTARRCQEPWNKGKLVGQKLPLKLKDIWAVRIRLQIADRVRDLALFEPGHRQQASGMRPGEIAGTGRGPQRASRGPRHGHATENQRPVQFEITEQTREAVASWIERRRLQAEEFLFPSRLHRSPHLSTRQYARIVDRWVREIGLDPAAYGTHSLRRPRRL